MEKERKKFVYGNKDGDEIINGCINNGIDEKVAHKIFDQMVDFASYAFNKSHAAAYALIAYETAYLMRYYKSEYICALLNSVINNMDKVCYYIKFGEGMNIKIFPPCVNNSHNKFIVDGEDIYFGLSAIKNLGEGACEKIVYYREKYGKFKDEYDFLKACVKCSINKRGIESIIKSGALDVFNVSRSHLLMNFEKIIDGMQKEFRENLEGQMDLFSLIEDEENKLFKFNNLNNCDISYDDSEKNLLFEKEVLGIYISGHPIHKHKEILHKVCTNSISDFYDDNMEINDGDEVIIGGLVREFKKIITKNNSIMCFLYIEDKYSSIECVVFPKIYGKRSYLINDNNIVIIKGVFKKNGDAFNVIVNEIIGIEEYDRFKLYILCDGLKEVTHSFNKAKDILIGNKGHVDVNLYSLDRKKVFRVNDYSVNLSNSLICELNKAFSQKFVKVIITK